MKDFLKAVVFIGLFAVPFLTLYVENDYFFPFITGKNFWFRIIVDVVFASWIILALYEVKYRPKLPGVVWSFGILLVIMFFANLFGLHPNSSFWSNFERMDGYVSLVHTFMYMLVLGSVLQTKAHWTRLLNTTLVVAFLVALYGLAQSSGFIEGSSRIDSRLGNAAYMAVYMLFHVFITFWLFIGTKNMNLKVVYGILAVMFAYVLIETGTRGTAIGFLVGILVMTSYIGLFGQQFKQYRKYAIGAAVVLLALVGVFIANKDSDFVQDDPNLRRIANISIDDLRIRGIIWGMAWEGVKERPILGYGQSNFNYVFNQNYDPRLYAQEQWFDRSHNIFMDWLVTGGFLGLIAYLSIFVWCVYYLLIRPLIDKEDQSFTVMERGILLGLLAGYFTHNFVVFDNIVSYIFFAIILGLIIARVGNVPEKLTKMKVDKAIITQFALPVVLVALIAVLIFAHRPGMKAAGDVLDSFRTPDPVEKLEAFEKALSRDSFAHQEITEQLSQQAMSVWRNPQIPQDIKNQYKEATDVQLEKLVSEKPGDARVHVFVGTYYRSVGEPDKAEEQMALARQFSPKKQSIIIQQGFVALGKGENEKAFNFFKEAYELDTDNLEALEYFAAAHFYTGNAAGAAALLTSDEIRRQFADSQFLISTANQFAQYDFAIDLFEYRVNLDPSEGKDWRTDPQNWATLAFLYYQAGDNAQAITTLRNGVEVIPTFEPTASCFINNLQAGQNPQVGC